MVYIENKYLNFEIFFVEIIAKKNGSEEEKILEKKPRVVEVPRVREARVREVLLYSKLHQHNLVPCNQI